MSEMNGRVLRKRNPGLLQPDDVIREQFVVREHELATVLEVLRGNVDADSCQHTLIVAPRGRGKTMLLARVAAELHTNREFSSRLLPVRFMEESDEILSAADFWLEVLFYLANAIDKQNPEVARNLRATRDDLSSRWRERELDERARVAVLETADALGVRLVLMVENLQALCANVDDAFGWKLRKTLQTEPQIILVATATSRFEALDDAQEPFFELFRIISLVPLDAAQCGRLWKAVSGEAADERQQRALEILTGGSPRYVVILSGFTRHRSMRRLMEELVQLIDDLTDTFRGYQEALPKTERRVFLSIADLWQPSTTGEIAVRARMDVRTVSTMLGRLVQRGSVISEGSGRKRLYGVAERLYCIYYKLRRERDEAAVVRNLVRFMAVLYREPEIVEIFDTLKLEALQSPAILAGIERARIEAPQLREFAAECAHTAQRSIDTAIKRIEHADYDAAIAACDDVITRFGASEVVELQVQVLKALINKGVAHGRRGDRLLEIRSYRHGIERFQGSDSLELQHRVASALFNTAVAQTRIGDHVSAATTYDGMVRRFGTSSDLPLRVYAAKALFNRGALHGYLGDHTAAIGAYRTVLERFGACDAVELQIEVANALYNTGVSLAHSGEHFAAIEACDAVITRYGSSDAPELERPVARAWLNKGVEHAALGDYVAAIATFDNIARRYASRDEAELQVRVAKAIGYKATICHRLGGADAAISASEEVVERYGENDTPALRVQVARALVQKGAALGELGRHTEAISGNNEVFRRYRKSQAPELQELVAGAMNNKAESEKLTGNRDAAIASRDKIVSLYGTSDSPAMHVQVAEALFQKGMLQIELGHLEEAQRTADDLERRLSAMTDGTRASCEWKASFVLMAALLARGAITGAIDAFCSVYAALRSDLEPMIPRVLEGVAILLSAGVPETEIIAILRTEQEKAAALAPLIIALRQRDGETVRAPAEVLEVAADVCRRIDATRSPRWATPRRTTTDLTDRQPA